MLRTLVCEFIGSFENGRWNSGTNNKHYDYLYLGSKDVAPGDHAFVHNGTHFGVVSIARVKPGISEKVLKTVIEVLTAEEFKQYEAANGQIHEHRKVFDQLEYLLTEEKKVERYRDLATRNPEAKALMDKIEAFQKGETLESALPAPTRGPIPAGVIWDDIRGDFYNGADLARDAYHTADEFRTKWWPRRSEFPTPSNQA